MISLEETRAGLLRVERLNLALSAGAVATSFAVATPGGLWTTRLWSAAPEATPTRRLPAMMIVVSVLLRISPPRARPAAGSSPAR